MTSSATASPPKAPEPLTRRSNSPTERAKRQAPRDPRLVPRPFLVRDLDPLERAHIDRRVREDANQARRKALEVQPYAPSPPHVDGSFGDKDVALERSAGRGHDARFEGFDGVDDCARG